MGWRRRVRVLMAILLTGGVLMPMHSYGQDVDPQVRQKALEAFHGPDLEGKDGPMAKVGFDLALLYHEWQAFQQHGEEGAFSPSASSLPVRSGHVTVDAIAAQDAAALQQALVALGLKDAAQAGRVVSGRLPIAAIPDAAQLASLRSMRPARAMIRSRVQPAPPETTATDEQVDAPNTVWYVVGGVIVALGALLLWMLR